MTYVIVGLVCFVAGMLLTVLFGKRVANAAIAEVASLVGGVHAKLDAVLNHLKSIKV
jgi:hypothetical protein